MQMNNYNFKLKLLLVLTHIISINLSYEKNKFIK